MNPGPVLAYKILTVGQAEVLQREGVFHGAPVDFADGYIHLSTAGQIAGTLDKHFAGQSELVIAAVDLAELGTAVRWEEARAGQLFPHLYSSLHLSAVKAIVPVERDADGAVSLPVIG